ncbi:LOW QUALITY PROTEIN: hypothetical protein CFC21_051921 [Triticum aestivum]|uniref:aldehyde oxygenase (deformylating) n=2 Tax=Triticum aestivum TaxID=4565 RepID=A0A9R1G8Q5_WHEAT|nr:LOW QUALITY PROTEIN: hypothetical protein CFC21_051921 [Triticum aestivum]
MGVFRFSDEAVAAVVPILVYWAYSGVHTALGHGRVMAKYRLNTKAEEDSKNTVSKRAVLGNVLMQHLMQLVAVTVLTPRGAGGATTGDSPATASSSYLTAAHQIAVTVVLYDAYGYAWHRPAHRSRFLYRHLHSWHHRLVVPYAFGVKYGHPVEALITDKAGASLAILASGMSSSQRATVVFLSLCNIKGIDNHCGLCLLPRRLQSLRNSAAYHGVHHLPHGVRYNFSDLFFVTWDKAFGTYLHYTMLERPGGGGW